MKQNWVLTFWQKMKTQHVLNELVFNRTTQDNVQIFEKFPFLRANKHTNSTLKMKTEKKNASLCVDESSPGIAVEQSGMTSSSYPSAQPPSQCQMSSWLALLLWSSALFCIGTDKIERETLVWMGTHARGSKCHTIRLSAFCRLLSPLTSPPPPSLPPATIFNVSLCRAFPIVVDWLKTPAFST